MIRDSDCVANFVKDGSVEIRITSRNIDEACGKGSAGAGHAGVYNSCELRVVVWRAVKVPPRAVSVVIQLNIRGNRSAIGKGPVLGCTTLGNWKGKNVEIEDVVLCVDSGRIAVSVIIKVGYHGFPIGNRAIDELTCNSRCALPISINKIIALRIKFVDPPNVSGEQPTIF